MISLFPHQQEALQETKDFDNIAVYHDMGLGKTFTGSEMMKRFGCKVNLIVCQKSKVQDWVEHFTDNYQMQVFDLTNKKQLGEYHGLSQGQRFFIVGVINYELAWRRKELLDLYDFTLMLDESSLIQNQKAKQTKFILKMKPAHVILLSGTPVGGKYENLWTQVHLLGWKISEVLANIKALVGNYLKSLGYPEAKPEVVAVDDSLSVPVYLEMTKSNGAPLLWVLLSASKESDAGMLYWWQQGYYPRIKRCRRQLELPGSPRQNYSYFPERVICICKIV